MACSRPSNVQLRLGHERHHLQDADQLAAFLIDEASLD
jgi:hypothetical protein